MTTAERIASLPTDRHVRYSIENRRGYRFWVARWFDDAHVRRARLLGKRLPADLPDYPCTHGRLTGWSVPTTDEERQEAIERGRKGNAMRKNRSNQYRKARQQERERLLGWSDGPPDELSA